MTSLAAPFEAFMKITALYYLQYPDCSPADPTLAASEVYVETASNEGDTDHFDETYSVMICTANFIKKHLVSHQYYCGRSVIVVERFEDSVIRNALESLLPRISEFAVKK